VADPFKDNPCHIYRASGTVRVPFNNCGTLDAQSYRGKIAGGYFKQLRPVVIIIIVHTPRGTAMGKVPSHYRAIRQGVVRMVHHRAESMNLMVAIVLVRHGLIHHHPIPIIIVIRMGRIGTFLSGTPTDYVDRGVDIGRILPQIT
jgi:hypothetical protein